MRIDAHHHLWHYSDKEFGWIGDRAAALRRDFLPGELEEAMKGAAVDLSVAVQARCTVDETHWLLACAATSACIAGVVGWVPLASATLGATLDPLAANPRFIGVREIVQDKAPGFLLGSAFNEGVRELTSRRLTYDILIHAGQMAEVLQFVDRHPKQRFVLDHAAKPEIAARTIEPWRSQLKELAQRSNVNSPGWGLKPTGSGGRRTICTPTSMFAWKPSGRSAAWRALTGPCA